jgi:CubicO group peptidase (beta-lactamase class C family)
VSRPVRRLLAAFALSAVALSGVIGVAPRGSPPTDGVADVAGAVASPTATAATTPMPTVAPSLVAPSPAAPQPTPTAPSVVPGSGPSATPALAAALDARLERWRLKHGAPGVSVAIVFADGSVWTGASGMADVKTGRAVTPDTAFSVASVSKTFTSALILDLAADGRLRLDARARSYVPDLPIDARITVRQLLDHTSGLRDFFLHKGIDQALMGDRDRTWDAAMSLKYVGKPGARPGTAWIYSNTNYLVLGLIAEKVGHASVAEQLRERFLTPLDLEHTWYQAAERARAPIARAYRLTGAKPDVRPIGLADGTPVVPFTSVVTASGAAGSIASTAEDLAHWVGALYGGGALAAAARAELTAEMEVTLNYRPRVSYGLGVQAFDIDGRPTLGHSGRFLGTRAAARWLPTQRIAIAVVTNQSRSDPGQLVADLLAIALPPPAPPICAGCPTQP